MKKATETPEAVVAIAKPQAVKKMVTGPKTKSKRAFPQYSIEECRTISDKIKLLNAGNPWSPKDIAASLSMGLGNNFFYLTQASRDYQLTSGTRDSDKIELSDLGRKL